MATVLLSLPPSGGLVGRDRDHLAQRLDAVQESGPIASDDPDAISGDQQLVALGVRPAIPVRVEQGVDAQLDAARATRPPHRRHAHVAAEDILQG